MNNKMFYILLAVLFGAVSCTKEVRLNTQEARDSEIRGNYAAIYYGCNFLNDLETIAFLEKEGGKYPFVPFAPNDKYLIKKGLASEEAIKTAAKFVNCNSQFRHTQLRRILGPEGETLGYEVRPLYLPFRFGSDDILEVDYWLKDNKVEIMVKLRASVELGILDNKRRMDEKEMMRKDK